MAALSNMPTSAWVNSSPMPPAKLPAIDSENCLLFRYFRSGSTCLPKLHSELLALLEMTEALNLQELDTFRVPLNTKILSVTGHDFRQNLVWDGKGKVQLGRG